MNRAFTLMVFMLVLLSLGVGYGLWSSILKANVTVHVLPIKLKVGSWKVFAGYSCGECRGYDVVYLSPDNTTLNIVLGNTIVEYMWVGLIIENTMEVDYYLQNIEVWLRDLSGRYNLTPQVYLYEPVKTGIGNMSYWDGVKCSELPVQGYLTGYPVLVKSGYKMVAWIYLEANLSNVEIGVKVLSNI